MGWRDFKFSTSLRDKEDKEDKVKPPTGTLSASSFDSDAEIDQRRMALNIQRSELNDLALATWTGKINNATTANEILLILGEFQILSWTDKQRGEISHTYHKKLSSLLTNKE